MCFFSLGPLKRDAAACPCEFSQKNLWGTSEICTKCAAVILYIHGNIQS